MKTWDLEKFKRTLPKGYKIGHSTRHHVIINPAGKEVIGFAIGHQKGGRKFILEVYVKAIHQAIQEDLQSKEG